jgi:hypothetical protein
MKKLSIQAPLIREAEEKELSALQKDWREYFGAKLKKFDAASPADLDDEKKKEFFNDLKKDWERGQGATNAGKKDIESHGVKEGEVNEADAKTEDTKAEALVKMIIKSNPRFKWLKTDLPNNYTLADVEEILVSNGYGKEFDKHIGKIKEGEEVNEARSIEKVSKDISKLASEMAELAKIWKSAEGKAKTDVLDSLKKKTADKKNLEKELEDLITGKDKDIELIVMEAYSVDEAEVKNDAEFKEYAEKVLKKAHKDDYDEKKAEKTIEGILKKSNGDYGAAVGMLTSGLS